MISLSNPCPRTIFIRYHDRISVRVLARHSLRAHARFFIRYHSRILVRVLARHSLRAHARNDSCSKMTNLSSLVPSMMLFNSVVTFNDFFQMMTH